MRAYLGRLGAPVLLLLAAALVVGAVRAPQSSALGLDVDAWQRRDQLAESLSETPALEAESEESEEDSELGDDAIALGFETQLDARESRRARDSALGPHDARATLGGRTARAPPA